MDAHDEDRVGPMRIDTGGGGAAVVLLIGGVWSWVEASHGLPPGERSLFGQLASQYGLKGVS